MRSVQRTLLADVDLSCADLSGANLTAANLNYATTDGADFTNAIWSKTICPDGTNSDTHRDGCASRRGPK